MWDSIKRLHRNERLLMVISPSAAAVATIKCAELSQAETKEKTHNVKILNRLRSSSLHLFYSITNSIPESLKHCSHWICAEC